MISRIQEIYREVYRKSSMAEIKDRQLSDIIQRRLEEIPDHENLTRQAIGDLVFAGSSEGQAQGFREGFRYAMALVFESLVC